MLSIDGRITFVQSNLAIGSLVNTFASIASIKVVVFALHFFCEDKFRLRHESNERPASEFTTPKHAI